MPSSWSSKRDGQESCGLPEPCMLFYFRSVLLRGEFALQGTSGGTAFYLVAQEKFWWSHWGRRGGCHWHLVRGGPGMPLNTGQESLALSQQRLSIQMSTGPQLRNPALEARNFGQENSNSKIQFPT